ncbi:hypothetical protein COCSUDRAFT_58139 [Coccomyxa subellipsoidea C-169]|uniref:Uncharacterized protein n=1 Tax=Coccomyxa subellipsoidea (strain C-169) TaxID=574566 RepID=I0YND5_COCSC|nr:hypothetical protein COCSUDRAFT_58139 [Coccomyxa subellipsoidea C-169]EIE19904.1 hypothetical protein COCSUDRAFT_58139 [Coccomyxa subellipsoidea C-169]|eukprot:XP_005644448.1 hypothetical protein COCSUDRAFT_58139 [Coccomyxa subellipsoidea C-169]
MLERAGDERGAKRKRAGAASGALPGAARIKSKQREVPSPDTPAQADKGKQRALTPQIHVSCDEAGPSGPPDQVARAGPSGPFRAAARSTRAAGQARGIEREEVIDLSPDSPRASTNTQLLAEIAVGLNQSSTGHLAADGGDSGQGSLAVKREQRMQAATAALPLAHAHPAPSRPSGKLQVTCTLSRFVADIMGVEGEKEQMAALTEMRRRAEEREKLLTLNSLKDAEIRSLRSQLEIQRA